MNLDVGTVAIFISILLALLAMSAAWGTLREKVKNIRYDIDKERKDNRDDHQRMFDKLEKIDRELNGKSVDRT